MRWPLLLTLVAAVLWLGGTRAVPAQPAPAPVWGSRTGSVRRPVPAASLATPSNRSRLSLWAARSVSAGTVLGAIRRGRMRLLGLRYTQMLVPTSEQDPAAHDAPLLTYTADLIPLARLHIPVEAMPRMFYLEGDGEKTALSTRGFGAYPFGLRVEFRGQRRAQPFVAGHTGALYFPDAVPDNRGRRLNFAAGFGGGVQVWLLRGTTLTVGYRYHHLSNGFRGSINPGFDVNMVYLEVGATL